MDNPPPTEEPICSREDVFDDPSTLEAVHCACRHESALDICVKPLSAQDSPFSVINVHVLENVGPFGVFKQEEPVCLNWVCFTLKYLSSAIESQVSERPVSDSVGM